MSSLARTSLASTNDGPDRWKNVSLWTRSRQDQCGRAGFGYLNYLKSGRIEIAESSGGYRDQDGLPGSAITEFEVANQAREGRGATVVLGYIAGSGLAVRPFSRLGCEAE
jgi:hypothetical protein